MTKKFLTFIVLALAAIGMYAADNPLKIQHASEEPIMEQPDGLLYPNCMKDSYAMFRDEKSGQGSASYIYGKALRILEGNDGNLYILRPFTNLSGMSWLKLDRMGDGEYVMRGMQYNCNLNGTDLYTCGMELYTKEDGGLAYRPTLNEEGIPTGDLVFTFKDGVLKMRDLVIDDTSSYPNIVLTLTNSEAERWMWAAEAYINVKIITDEPTQIPQDCNVSRGYMTYYAYENNEKTQQIDVIFNEGEVFINNPYSWNPNQWIKGYIQDDQIIFYKQYLGGDLNNQMHLWFMPGKFEEIYDSTSDEVYITPKVVECISLNYDVNNHKIWTNENDVMLISRNGEEYANTYLFHTFSIEEIPNTPATPQGVMEIFATRYSSTYGNGQLYMLFSEYSEDGNIMNNNNLYYNVYVDTEDNKYTATTELYPELEEDTVDIPYRFNKDGIHITANYRVFNFYFSAYERFGAQLIYRSGGEERRSNIFWTDGEVTKVDQEVGIDNIKSMYPSDITIYNLQGQPIVNPIKGQIYIRSIRMSNGTTITEKFIMD